MARMWTRALLVGAMGIATGGAVGCAQERAPINQVQADALAKSFFVGKDLANAADDPEFYMRGTIVDVGYGAAQDGLFTSTYAQPVQRVRWQITENYLNARLSYERIASTDGKGNMADGLIKKTVEDGQIVASYKITSHFDIRRSYNPTTGEELNVVVENSTDRPWYQREYFRIDWSQNLATDAYQFDTLASLGISSAIQYSPLAYTVLDPNDPDAPHFDAQNGYFDVTVKAFAVPQTIDLTSLGWGIKSIPACNLPGEFAGGTAPYGNCGPSEITLRYSFKQVVDKDYEPVNYDGYRFQAFGIFTTERQGYARDYGMTDADWYRFASRYNIWQRSHFYADPDNMNGAVPCATFATTEQPTGDPNADPNRDTDKNGTADECEAVTAQSGHGGSRCDVFTKKCTLPYQARTPVVIPWYVNGYSTNAMNSLQAQLAAATDPQTVASLQQQIATAQKQGEDLFEATNWGVQEWDLAMKTAIQTSRLVECRRTGGGAQCDTLFPMWTGQQEDNDEAVAISRDLDLCRRTAALGSSDPTTQADSDALEAARTAGWTSQDCVAKAQQGAAAVAAQRKNTNDPSAAAMAKIVPMDPVIVLCHNPVIQSDHPACGPLGLSPRLGDLRYNTVLNIDKPQTPSAWGIMVDADDPLTGEKVAASINIWTAVTDMAAQNLVDLVRYINGELTTADITNGNYVTNWANAVRLAAGGRGPTMTRKQISQRLAAATGVDTGTYEAAIKKQMPSSVSKVLQTFKAQQVSDIAQSNDVASPSAATVAARAALMHGSTTEATLLNTAMLQRAGLSGPVASAGVGLDQASPMTLNNPRVASQLQKMRQASMAAQGYCLLEDAPEASSLTGIADAMKRKFPRNAQMCSAKSECASGKCTGGHCVETAEETATRYDNMLGYIRRRYHYAVLAHEMGHSIGLRHNFVSSFAALHFRPQYWQLRTANGTQTTPCTDVAQNGDGSTCTGPRYWDPLTEEEQSQMIWMFQQSTVMDYPGDVSQDTLGLGAYDFAAARMFYGDVTSVYNVKQAGSKALDPNYLSAGMIGQGMLATTDNFGGLTGIQYTLGPPGSTPIHYSQLQSQYNLISNCQEVTPKAPDWWRSDVDGVWDQVFDGKIVSVGGKATKCRSLEVDYMGWNDLRMPAANEVGGSTNNYRGGNAVDPTTHRVRVPYSFASDNWADLGNVSVFRHDNGADPYEQLQFLITTQEDRHILDNFRRGRNTFSVRAASDRSYQRYNEKMLGIAGGIGFLNNIYKDVGTGQGWTFETWWPNYVEQNLKENMIAATVAFDHFTRQLSRPESGPHYFLSNQYDSNLSSLNLPPSMQDMTLRSSQDGDGFGPAGSPDMVVPEGSTGYLGIEMPSAGGPLSPGSIGFGGHLLENSLSMQNGDYDVDYTLNCGGYYDKINTAILFSLSEDRFISQSRQDFYDARFRSVGMADVLPDGWRRVIANALTGDRSIMASQVTATATPGALPVLVPDLNNSTNPYDPKDTNYPNYPVNPIGWTSWWPAEGPMRCFPSNGSNVCASYAPGIALPGGGNDPGFKPQNLTSVGLDPQIGWEVQKFLIAWTLQYIPADDQSNWLDMMRIYRIGQNADPQITNRVEWQDPVSQELFYAASYGKECLFGPPGANSKASCEVPDANGVVNGHWVEKGIAARVLEYANFLSSKAYACDLTAGGGSCFNAFGRYMVKRQSDGTPLVQFDPTIQNVAGGSDPFMPALSLTGGPCDLTAPPDCETDAPFPWTNPAKPTGPGGLPYCDAGKLHAMSCPTAPQVPCTQPSQYVSCSAPLAQTDNHWAVQLAAYKEIPNYLWQVVVTYNLATPGQLGLFAQ